MIEDLIRCLAMERRVRTRLIEPFLKKRKFPVERFTAKWHEDPARTFVLEAQDESFNECDTHVLANSTEAGCDLVVITPILEHAAPELLALVGDVYLGVVLAVLMAHSRKRETDTAVGLCLKVSMPITRRE